MNYNVEGPGGASLSFSSSLVVLPFLNGEEDELCSSVGVSMYDNSKNLAYAQWLIAEEGRIWKRMRAQRKEGVNGSNNRMNECTSHADVDTLHDGNNSFPETSGEKEISGDYCQAAVPYRAWRTPRHHRFIPRLSTKLEGSDNTEERQHSSTGRNVMKEASPLTLSQEGVLSFPCGQTPVYAGHTDVPQEQRKRSRDATEKVNGDKLVYSSSSSVGTFPSSFCTSSTLMLDEKEKELAVRFESLLSSLLWCSEGGKDLLTLKKESEEKNMEKRGMVSSPLFLLSNRGDMALQHLQRIQERIALNRWVISSMEAVRWAEQQEFLKQLSRIRDATEATKNKVNQLKARMMPSKS